MGIMDGAKQKIMGGKPVFFNYSIKKKEQTIANVYRDSVGGKGPEDHFYKQRIALFGNKGRPIELLVEHNSEVKDVALYSKFSNVTVTDEKPDTKINLQYPPDGKLTTDIGDTVTIGGIEVLPNAINEKSNSATYHAPFIPKESK